MNKPAQHCDESRLRRPRPHAARHHPGARAVGNTSVIAVEADEDWHLWRPSGAQGSRERTPGAVSLCAATERLSTRSPSDPRPQHLSTSSPSGPRPLLGHTKLSLHAKEEERRRSDNGGARPGAKGRLDAPRQAIHKLARAPLERHPRRRCAATPRTQGTPKSIRTEDVMHPPRPEARLKPGLERGGRGAVSALQ